MKNYFKQNLKSFGYFSWAIIILAFVVYLANTWYFHSERWDDAYITFRFAQNVAAGQGLIWNIGGEPVEGFTSILHVLLLAFGIKMGISPWLGSLIISIAAVLTTVSLMLAVIWRQFNYIHPVAAVFIGIFLIDVQTAIHTTSGLETQVFVALLCACYYSAFLFIDSSSWWSAVSLGIFTFVACLGRPEAVIYGVALFFVLAVFCVSSDHTRKDNKEKLLKLSVSLGFVILAGLSYLAWKYNYFGYLLPNPYYVKSSKVTLAGLPEVAEYLKHLAKWLAPLLLAGLFFIFRGNRKKQTTLTKIRDSVVDILFSFKNLRVRSKIFLTLAPPLLALAYYSTIMHEVGGAYRFSYPTYFYFVLGFAMLFSFLIHSLRLEKVNQIMLTAVAVSWIGFLLILQTILQAVWNIPPAPPTPYHQYHSKIAKALKTTEIGSEGSILCIAAGLIPYESGFNQLDPVGLTDNVLSGRKPLTPEEREAYIWSRQIDVYIGYEPPAQPGAEQPEDDPQMKSQYVDQILMRRELEKIEPRVFIQDPQLLHSRMRELRDNWHLVGEISWFGRDWWQLKSFVYVRRDSPHKQKLIRELKKIIELEPHQVKLNDIERKPN